MKWDANQLRSIAKEFGTPLYVYSLPLLRARIARIQAAFQSHPTLICYAVKANGNLSLLRNFFQSGFGADVVSEGELLRALRAGVAANQIVFSGVGKTEREIRVALENEILSFHVESLEELSVLSRVAESLNKTALIALRINPNIPVKTNPYIATGIHQTKFGIPEARLKDALKILRRSKPLKLIGLSCHLGSQIPAIKPYQEAAARLRKLAQGLAKDGHHLEFLDFGGGFPIPYRGEKYPEIEDIAEAMISELKNEPYRLVIEPGRWLVGPTGILLTEVIHRKQGAKKTFVIVDAAMNDLIRPALYEAHHEISALTRKGKPETVDIVGPICETGDYLGLNRKLPKLQSGDLLLLENAGAYGSSMASNYNSRPRAAEVLIDEKSTQLIRRREPIESLWSLEIPHLT